MLFFCYQQSNPSPSLGRRSRALRPVNRSGSPDYVPELRPWSTARFQTSHVI